MLRPVETYAIATFNVQTRFTRISLPAGQNIFSLLPYGGVESVTITKFRLKVDHICADGSPLTVIVKYIADGQGVSHPSS